jgi:hypothetical protein
MEKYLFIDLLKGTPIYSIPLSPSPSGEGWDEVLRENTCLLIY